MWFRNAMAIALVIASSQATFAQRKSGQGSDNGHGHTSRMGRILSPFQIVTFPNAPCIGSTKNGTCYTAQECSSIGGANGGSCANGFGVCCIVTINCGGVSSQNCTYFDSNAVTSGACSATICPCNNNICQLRLDFQTFQTSGPSTSSMSAVATSNGNPTAVTSSVAKQSLSTQCLTDTFSVTNPNGAAPPTICGTNSGEHMYVDSSPSCNMLNFQLGNAGVGTSIGTGSWSIKITQYSCNYPNLAPQGCTQYFFGSSTGTFESYNYNSGNGKHLANQQQTICFRRESTFCRICYTTVNDPTDFDVSGKVVVSSKGAVTPSTVRTKNNQDAFCCSYSGATNEQSFGYDCLQIPGAIKAAPTGANIGGTGNTVIKSNYCGNSGLVTTTTTVNTVCSTRQPFIINFRTDNFEAATMNTGEAGGADAGFRLAYFMDANNCNQNAQTNQG